MTGSEAYQCNACKGPRDAEKRLVVDSAPRVLIIQLSRFDALGRKIGKFVEFPKKFELKSVLPSSRDRGVYELYGMIVHTGISVNAGHYYCYVLASDGSWYYCNDNKV